MQRRRTLFSITALLLVTTAAPADTITLKSSVRLRTPAETIRLRDVAHLEGDAALDFADLAVADNPGVDEEIIISIDTVQRLLEDAGAHWGRIDLGGRAVVVRPPRRPAAAAPTAMGEVALVRERQTQSAPVTREAGTIRNDATLRGAIARAMVDATEQPPDALRLTFAAEDATRLDLSDRDQRFELRAQSNHLSDRIIFSVRVWQSGLVVDEFAITVRPTLRVSIATLTRDVARNATLAPTDIDVSDVWLPPSQATLAIDPATAVGRVATVRLKEGSTLRAKHLERQTLIERGDLVTVRCPVGGLVIALQAEARADGAEGDRIPFRKRGERAEFMATILSSGQAVVDLSHRGTADARAFQARGHFN